MDPAKEIVKSFLDSVWNPTARDRLDFEVFALGYATRRLTVHTQQNRAINLAALLRGDKRFGLDQEQIERFNKVKNVCVIGGGVTGMTFAAGAALIGKKVTLIERHTELLHLQRGNHTRWIHPNIYDWPRRNSEYNKTDLPFLNWNDGLAGAV